MDASHTVQLNIFQNLLFISYTSLLPPLLPELTIHLHVTCDNKQVGTFHRLAARTTVTTTTASIAKPANSATTPIMAPCSLSVEQQTYSRPMYMDSTNHKCPYYQGRSVYMIWDHN